MNIFVLDLDVVKCAEYHVDSHVRKMILESAQLLSNAHYFADNSFLSKKPGYLNHPCSVWTRTSKQNYEWLSSLAWELLNEFDLRFDKIHAYQDKIHWFKDCVPNLPDIGLTDFSLAMPDYCKIENNTVASYRNYYCIEKTHLAKWTLRQAPKWYKDLSFKKEAVQ